MQALRGHRLGRIGLGLVLGVAVLAIAGALVWHGLTTSAYPDTTAHHLDRTAVMLGTAILVFREGLEAVLVLAAITASFTGAHAPYRRPVAAGAGAALLATAATWFIAVAVVDALGAPAVGVQAATGLVVVAVLLVVTNWFVHKVYWTGWISFHNRRRRALMARGHDERPRVLMGLALLGCTAVYREGFEVVLFLQYLRLQAGVGAVMQGVMLGLGLTALVGALTFLTHYKLPYKKMLVVSGGVVVCALLVTVGANMQEMQQAGWLSATPLRLPIPGWMGAWLGVFPTVESVAAQVLAAAIVIGSYVVAEGRRVKKPQRRSEAPVRGSIGSMHYGEPAGRAAIEPAALGSQTERSDMDPGRVHGPATAQATFVGHAPACRR